MSSVLTNRPHSHLWNIGSYYIRLDICYAHDIFSGLVDG
jgi:hypothetical protein